MPVLAPIVPESEPIEEVIGSVVAAAGLAMLAGAQQWIADGQVLGTPAQKQHCKTGGAYIAQLFELQKATRGEFDFEQTARTFGAMALKKRFNGHGCPAAAGDILIDEVMAAVRKVTVIMQAMDAADEAEPHAPLQS